MHCKSIVRISFALLALVFCAITIMYIPSASADETAAVTAINMKPVSEIVDGSATDAILHGDTIGFRSANARLTATRDSFSHATLTVNAYGANGGYYSNSTNGPWASTNAGGDYYLWGMSATISGAGLSGGISYSAWVSAINWESGYNGGMVGGGNNASAAWQMSLSGEYARAYSLSYNVHGWDHAGGTSATVSDGEIASDANIAIDGIGYELNPRSYTHRVYVCYQNADGSWGSPTLYDSFSVPFGDWIDGYTIYGNDTYTDGYADGYRASYYDDSRTIYMYRRTSTNKIYARYQNAEGGWGSYSVVSEGTDRVGQVRSWSRAADATYNAASGSITATRNGQTKYVDVSRKKATNTIYARYETSEGGWSDYSQVSSGSDYVGHVRSWSRNADSTYQAASGSITGTQSAQTKYVSVYRWQATNTIMVRYQDKNGNWGEYASASSGKDRVGHVRSWSRAEDDTYNAASGSITGRKDGQTIYVDVIRKEAVNTIYARYQQGDGSWSDYETVSSGTDKVGYVRSWTYPQDATYLEASTSITGTKDAQTAYVDVYRQTYTTSFDSCGGSSVASYTRLAGSLFKVPTPPTREGYDFMGWRTKPDGAGDAVTESTVTPSADVTYYADWRLIIGDVSFSVADADMTTSQGSASLDGAEYQLVNTGTNEVYVNGHWYGPSSVCATVSIDGSTASFEDISYGTYTISEVHPSEGYMPSDESRTFSIRTYQQQVNLTDTPYIKHVQRGGMSMAKYDADMRQESGQGNASVETAAFDIINQCTHDVVVSGVRYEPNEVCLQIEIGRDGTVRTDTSVLPYGHYSVREAFAPSGYTISSKTYPVDITYDGELCDLSQDPTYESIWRSKLEFVYRDSDSHETWPQGDAVLSGARFTIDNVSKRAVFVDKLIRSVGSTCTELNTDANGYASTPVSYLPYGRYVVSQSRASVGYRNLDTKQYADATEDGATVTLSAAYEADVMRGGCRVQMVDATSHEAWPQGDASLAGSVFRVVNRSANPVIVDGVTYGVGDAVMDFTTDEAGVALISANTLPYGTYEVYQVSPSEGYGAAIGSKRFSVRNDNEICDLRFDVFSENVHYGAVSLRRADAVLDYTPQGDSDFTGAVYEIVNRSAMPVIIGGATYEPGTVCRTIRTGADGIARTDAVLPYGTYEIREQTPSYGYDANTQTRTFEIRSNGVHIDMTGEPFTCAVTRGGLSVSKVDSDGLDGAISSGFAGFEIEIRNDCKHPVEVAGTVYNSGDIIGTYKADSTGHVLVPDGALPIGRYSVRESGVPSGYDTNPAWYPVTVH